MKRPVKKLLCLVLALVLTAGLAACGSKVDVPKQYRDYVIPWELDAGAAAVKDSCMHYYFMSGEGGDYGSEDSKEKWGDSCLIVFPNGKTMLIDAGMADYAAVLRLNLLKLGVEKLDYVVISHPHSDHAYGAVMSGGILDRFPVGQVYYNGIHNAAWSDPQAVERACGRHEIPCTALAAGDTLEIGGVHIEVLWPEPGLAGQTMNKTPDINNASLVMRFDYGEHSALFTGDLYMAGERQLIEARREKLDVDLLKMCHHGDDTSNHPAFAEATTPEIAVATGYIYVRTQTYQNYTRHGAQVLLDSEDGYVHVTAAQDGTLTGQTSRERKINIYENYEYRG